jgi:hypothetical protein
VRGTQGPPGAAGGSSLFWSAIAAAGTSYYAENFFAVVASSATPRPSNRIKLPSARAFRGLQVWLTATPSKDVTVTVYKNGVATALTLTVPSGQVFAEEIVTQVTCAAGDVVALLVSHTAGTPFAVGRVIAHLGEG